MTFWAHHESVVIENMLLRKVLSIKDDCVGRNLFFRKLLLNVYHGIIIIIIIISIIIIILLKTDTSNICFRKLRKYRNV